MYLTGDTRYPRHSISLFRDSHRWGGLVDNRTPSYNTQIIPYFALLWVLMVNDFWEFAGEAERSFVRCCLHGVDGVLGYFSPRQAACA